MPQHVQIAGGIVDKERNQLYMGLLKVYSLGVGTTYDLYDPYWERILNIQTTILLNAV